MRILTVSLIVAAAAVTLAAQGPRGPRDGARTPNFDAVTEALGLTADQVTALQQNNEALREQMRTVFEAAAEKREALEAELENANPNPTIVGQLMLDARATQKTIPGIRAEAREKNLALLTEQQKTALAALAEGEKRSPALRQAAMLNLVEGREGGGHGGRGMGGPEHGPGHGGFGGGPRG